MKKRYPSLKRALQKLDANFVDYMHEFSSYGSFIIHPTTRHYYCILLIITTIYTIVCLEAAIICSGIHLLHISWESLFPVATGSAFFTIYFLSLFTAFRGTCKRSPTLLIPLLTMGVLSMGLASYCYYEYFWKNMNFAKNQPYEPLNPFLLIPETERNIVFHVLFGMLVVSPFAITFVITYKMYIEFLRGKYVKIKKFGDDHLQEWSDQVHREQDISIKTKRAALVEGSWIID